MLRRFKYNQLRELKAVLIEIVLKGLDKNRILKYWQRKGFLLLPIPLFPPRQLWRGFNQSRVLAQSVGEKLGFQVLNEEVLIRTRWTLAQAKLEAKKRQKNLQGAFLVRNKKAISGKRIILFDDVFTTGTTLKEAAKTLKQTGVKEVWGLVICRIIFLFFLLKLIH